MWYHSKIKHNGVLKYKNIHKWGRPLSKKHVMTRVKRICGCGKVYNSNEAFSRHKKYFHNGNLPPNTILPKRGRPCKNI